jgi:hypothetical protein
MMTLALDEASAHVAGVFLLEVSAQQEQTNNISAINNVNSNNSTTLSIIIVKFVVLLMIDRYIKPHL